MIIKIRNYRAPDIYIYIYICVCVCVCVCVYVCVCNLLQALTRNSVQTLNFSESQNSLRMCSTWLLFISYDQIRHLQSQ